MYHFYRAWAVAGVAFLLVAGTLPAADVDFVGPAGGDWNTAGNWSTGQVPGSITVDNVFVLVPGAGTKTISLSANAPAVNEVGLAREGNGTTTVNQTGGTLNVNSWFNLGQGFGGVPNNGTGVWNMSNDAVVNSTHSAGGNTVIGAGFTAAPNYNTGRLTITDTAQFIQTGGEFRVGGEDNNRNAYGYVTVSGSGVLSTGPGLALIGNGSATSYGELLISDSGTLQTGGSVRVANYGSSTGLLSITGGTINVASGQGLMVWDGHGTINIGQDVGKTTQVTASWITLGQNTGVGVLNQTGGTVTLLNNHLYIGYGAAANGTYNLSGGTLSINGDIRTDSGTGLFNQTGGATTANWIRMGINATASGEFDLSAGTVQVNSEARIGENGYGVLRVSGTGALTVGGDLNISQGANQGRAYVSDSGQVTANVIRVGYVGTGYMSQTGGTVNSRSWFVISQNANAIGTYDMTGGTLNVDTVGGGDLQVGVQNNGTGTFNISGGAAVNILNGRSFRIGSDHVAAKGFVTQTGASTVSLTGDLIVGQAGRGTYLFDAASLTTGRVRIGTNSGSVGAFYHLNGSLTTTGGASVDHFAIGNGGGGYGYYELQNGSISTFEMNVGMNGPGVLNMTGGTITPKNWFTIGRGGYLNNGPGVASVTGGTIDFTTATNEFTVGWDSRAELNVGGTGVVQTGPRYLRITGAGDGIVNLLSGGRIQALGVNDAGGGPSYFNFHGGTLQANAANGTFMQGLANAFVYSEGAVIDTNGFDITVAQPLLAPTGNGLSSIALSGGGAGYIGEPIVQITGDGVGASARATFDRATGTVTGIVITNPGTGYTTAAATLLGGGATTPAGLGAVTLAANATTGGLTKQGAGTLTLSGPNTFTGDTRSVTGTLGVNNTLALQYSTLDMNAADAGLVTFAQASTLGGLKGSRDVAYGGNALSVGNNNTDQTYSGSLSGTSALSKIGTGTWTLTGTSTINSNLFARFGTLEVDTGGNLNVTSYTCVGLAGGDTGRLVVRGTGQATLGDLNASDQNNSQGTVVVRDTGRLQAANTWVGKSPGTVGRLDIQDSGWVQANGFWVGSYGNSVGTVNQSGGTMRATAGGDGTLFGVDAAAKGVYNISGGLFDVTAGNLQVGWNGTGELNASGTGQVNVAGWFAVGRQVTGVGTVSASGNAVVNANGPGLILGELGNGTLNIADNAQVWSNHLRVGFRNNAQGTFNQTGGTMTVNGDVYIAEEGESIGQYTISNGTFNANGGVMRVGAWGTGTMTQTGGTVNTANWFVIGQGGNKTSTFNMSGGVLNVNTNGGGEKLQISVWDTAQGIMNVSGDARVTVNSSALQVGGDQAGARGTLTLADTGVISTPELDVAWTGPGTVTQDGGTMQVTGSHLFFGRGGSPTGTYNLNGGVLQVAGDIRNDNGTAIFNQTGGTATAQYLRMALGGGTTAQFTATGGTTTISQEADFGARGTASLTVGSISPASFATVTLNELWMGRSRWGGGESGGTATVRVYGDGQLTVNGAMQIGGTATSTINVEGGLFRSNGAGDSTLLGVDSARGVLNVSGGRFDVTTGNLHVGWNGTGELNASGTGQVNVAGWFAVGRQAGGVGTATVRDSAVLNANGGALILGEGGTGTLNVHDSARVNAVNQLWVGFVNTGTANLNGGLVKTPSTVIAVNGGSTGTLNLAGGTLDTANLSPGAGTATFNWSGGTLKPGTARLNVANPSGRLEVSQQGWSVGWYNSNDMTDLPDTWNLYTPPIYVETVNAINWDGAARPAGVNGDYSGQVYAARLYVPTAGNYSFRERVDDASALYIDGTKRLWDYTAASDFGEPAGNPWEVNSSTTVSLSKGWHLLDFRYSDHWGGQNAYLDWDPTGGTTWSILTQAGLGTDIGMSIIQGNYTQGAAGELALDIMGLPFGFDQLLVTGTANLDGTIHAIAGPDVRIGDQYVVLQAGGLSGAFDNVIGGGFSFADGYWLASYDYQAGTVTLTAAVPEPVTLGLLALSMTGLGGYIRRRRRR